MLLQRKAEWYRPYYVIAGGREYRVGEIHFYQNGKIIVSSYNGWLENSKGRDIDSIELPIDEIKVKRKTNFNGEIFVISQGKESYGDDLLAKLYIPAEMFNVHFVKNEIFNSSQVRSIYKGNIGDTDIYITSFIKSIDEELYNIRTKYDELYKKLSDVYLSIHDPKDVLNDIDNLKEMAEKYYAERKRIQSLTIDDIEVMKNQK